MENNNNIYSAIKESFFIFSAILTFVFGVLLKDTVSLFFSKQSLVEFYHPILVFIYFTFFMLSLLGAGINFFSVNNVIIGKYGIIEKKEVDYKTPSFLPLQFYYYIQLSVITDKYTRYINCEDIDFKILDKNNKEIPSNITIKSTQLFLKPKSFIDRFRVKKIAITSKTEKEYLFDCKIVTSNYYNY